MYDAMLNSRTIEQTIEAILTSGGMTPENRLSTKTGSAVLRVRRGDTGSFILRLYAKEVTAYRQLEWHGCEGFPQVYRTYSEEGVFVVEEELIDGVSLHEMLEGGTRFDGIRAASTTLKVCEALELLHSKGFIHRDVKPEHILITPENRVVLIDLDASMRIESGRKNDTQLIGTAMYAAPEQFGLTRSDSRTDIYAMGILINEMLTGKHPAVQQYRKGRLGRIIEKCTKISPEDRYQTIAELTEALNEATDISTPKSRKVRKATRTLAAGLTAAAAAAFFFVAVFSIWGGYP